MYDDGILRENSFYIHHVLWAIGVNNFYWDSRYIIDIPAIFISLDRSMTNVIRS